ncbi:hypothetical protein CASFOL_034458 [Castilleja foliolosa]|uniref:Uncharacterized protein n=1 Tax=Castilleja foliolosa TaxID=1961234 RepID=A0ABD3BX81_9LAMI
MKVKGSSNTTSAVNVQVSGGSTIKTPVIVKGGVNYITVSNLRASFGQGATAGSSRSKQSPNTASTGSSPNTAPTSSQPTTRKKPFSAPRPSKMT